MTKESELFKRLEQLEKANKELQDWKDKCDRMALKWGSFAMGILFAGAAIMIGFDKAWDKIGDLFITWGAR